MGIFKQIGSALAGAVFLSQAIVTQVSADSTQQSPQTDKTREYILATASPGGTYYPVGIAVATLAKVKIDPAFGLSLRVVNSAGSAENLKLLREQKAQFAIMQGLYGAWAWNGTGPLQEDGPQRELRSVSLLWQNVEQFVVREKYARTGSIDDIRQLRSVPFSIGKRHSGTEGSGRQIMTALGMHPGRYQLRYLGYGASADALQNGTIDGMNIPSGVPTSAITRAFAAMPDQIRVLDFTDAQIAQANRDLNLWSRYVIPAGTYPGQSRDIRTMAQPNFLAVQSAVSEEDVYRLTKAIYENLPFLHGIHKATRDMALNKAIAGLPVPLHPGAARYYQEQGLRIPPNLIAPES